MGGGVRAMADIAVMLGCLVTGLLILRSLGGEGLNISFKLSPISSRKGEEATPYNMVGV
jgi:hypothetical protein